MSATDLLDLWELPRDFDLAKMTEVALERLAPPDARAHLVSIRGDVLTVQVAEGTLTDGADFLYVGGRGAFEVLRREVWPGGRVLLTLAARPHK